MNRVERDNLQKKIQNFLDREIHPIPDGTKTCPKCGDGLVFEAPVRSLVLKKLATFASCNTCKREYIIEHKSEGDK